MVARKRSSPSSTVEAVGDNPKQLEKLIKLAALFVVKGESRVEKIKVLAGAGFANTEIAELLGLTANAVNVALHRMRAKN